MDNLVRGALVGIAVGGFVAAVVEANKLAVRTLLRFNFLAAEAAGCMFNGFYNDLEDRQKKRRQEQEQELQQQRKQVQWTRQQVKQWLVENETETETESESETESETP